MSLTAERRAAIRAKAPTYVAADSAIIVLDALEVAEKQIAAVRALHFALWLPHNRLFAYCAYCRDEYGFRQMWPCRTINALGGAS